MQHYWDIIVNSYTGYWNYLLGEISHLSWHNYFWWLVGLSLFAWTAEILFPWRKDQPRIRQDFWLDGFYMFFNYFLFSLIAYNAVSNVAVDLFNSALAGIGITNIVAIQVGSWPRWAQLLTLFLVADFIHWNVHRMLHRVPWMWKFHQVHHSVKQMGFAAHLRFHWMENVFYKSAQYIPLAMIGFGLEDFFIVHIFATAIGHLNHSNLNLSYGPLKYVLNNPRMHIWHHVKELPAGRKYGINYGISLSLWDYLFGTAVIPSNGRDIELGFPGDETFPKRFIKQLAFPPTKK
ncbi:MAG: sterol desaturase family protein [Flavobacteriales bacterium]|nr:sterol desaturase family protein [Flavobacteriales bacterium]MBK9058493.1 sterol desaturase family protein [Flavobacteriales bacterium]MBP9160121.1 sterol desaturase family protein [Flavobacteriales bacterium]QQS71490.1 MAG: sterol desaturase family protein [Flavobacteriales bacterium]HQV40318.1 sterol desaturase family protein [Flavobacteriales bacterium]